MSIVCSQHALRNHISERIIDDVIHHYPCVIHQVAHRPQVICQHSLHVARPAVLSEFLVHCFGRAVTLVKHRRVRAAAVAVHEIEQHVVFVVHKDA